MENKKQISVVTFAIFSISLLLFVNLITNPQNMAYATSEAIFSVDKGKVNIFYQNSTDNYFGVSTITGYSTATMSLNFYKITDSAGTVVKTSYTIKPQYGGCEPINNPCNVNGGSGESGIVDSANRPNINVA